LLLVSVATSASAFAAQGKLQGGGATFPALMYEAWIKRFKEKRPELAVTYESIGSGEGWARFATGKVDFAASETIVPSTVVEEFENVLQAPVTAGMIAVAYNLPDVQTPLKLPRSVLASIFLGEIKTWNDPRILAANPGVHLSPRIIAPVVRSDSSGTTFAFTRHLAVIDAAWLKGPGFGKLVSWPEMAIKARGNGGVASEIAARPGAIGYVEYGYAQRLGLKTAAIENRKGRFVAPSEASGSAALASSDSTDIKALANSLVDPSSEASYPIVSYSFILLRRHYVPAQAGIVKAFVSLALGEGQGLAVENGYLPLPTHVASFARNILASVNLEEETAAERKVEKPAEEGTASASTAAVDMERHEGSRERTSYLTAEALMEPTRPLYYRVSGRESLRDVAVKIYKDPDQWAFIAAINPEIDPKRRLKVGQMLRLP
jgi:phosphate transport system substrate-binding protein